VPFKANQDRRHHIPKQRHRVTNWAAYDVALRQRGSLTVWFTEAAIAAWKAEPRATRGGQPRYSALAITTALTLRTVFRLALRQTEGLIASLLRLLGLDLAAPDHSTMSRRARHCPCRDHDPAANRYICWWTAQGSSSAVPVSGSSRSTPQGRVGPGESSISAWTPRLDRSSPPS
jgi:Transposase DDE domain